MIYAPIFSRLNISLHVSLRTFKTSSLGILDGPTLRISELETQSEAGSPITDSAMCVYIMHRFYTLVWFYRAVCIGL